MSRTLRILISLLAMAVAMPAIAQVTDDDIDEARREVDQIMSDAQALGDEVQQAWSRQFALDKEISDLAASIDVARARIAETEKKLEEVAVEMYMGSSSVASSPTAGPNAFASGSKSRCVRFFDVSQRSGRIHTRSPRRARSLVL